MNRIRREWPALVERSAGAVKLVRNHHAIDRFGGMARPPPNHNTAQIILVENVPQRFRCSGKVRDRLHAAAILCRLRKTVDAVLEWPLSGGDGSPKHGRERWMERGNLSRSSGFHQPLDVGHFAGGQERRITFQSAASHPMRRTLRRAIYR